MLLIDKYTPTSPDQLIFHKELFEKLLKISQDDSIPHILFYGPPESGKKTIIRFFLEAIFDKSVNKLSPTTYEIKTTNSTTTKEVVVQQSNHHIVIEPNNNNYDRHLIQDVVKSYARLKPMNVFTAKRNFKMVLINNIDNLTYYAQTSLRRTMEKYSSTCRFIMWCRSLSKILDPLISRCLCIRVPAPTDQQILRLMMDVSVMEKIKLSFDDYYEIRVAAKNRINKTFHLLEWKKAGIDNSNSFDTVIDDIANHIINGKNTNELMIIRTLLYQITVTNISGTIIIRNLLDKLLELIVDDNIKYEIINYAAEYEHRLVKGRREIIHLEGFINMVFCKLRS